MREPYNHRSIEAKWQKYWQENKTNLTKENGDKKFYILDMFPYPSGEGLHVGHPKGYIATDVYSRMKRMQGYDVLHPMGFDAFGLPAEQYALKNKVNPNVSTAKNVARYKEQLKVLGLNYDWDREVNTTDPLFYKWTQWMWKQMYKKGLAYESYDPINWCPSCKTGLANEDLENGLCERCGSVVEKKPLRQWTIRITKYADRLLSDLDKLDWEPHIKELQRNWIGKSEGSEIDFAVEAGSMKESFTVFTTRADTLFGCTYTVLAPEHALVDSLLLSGVITNVDEVRAYKEKVAAKSDMDRTAEGKEKTGVRLEGVYAINPANQERVPIYIADYVLASYGTGAIMAVPAHDERDYEFAKKFAVEVKSVIATTAGVELENAKQVEGSVAIAYDPHTKKFLKLINTTSNEAWLPGGGRDEGESFLQTAKRELQEEGGYVASGEYFELGSPIISYYYNNLKQSNRRSLGYSFLFFVDSTQKATIAHESHEHYRSEWVTYEELYEAISTTKGGVDHWLLILKRAKEVIDGKKYILTSGDGVLINSGVFDGLTSSEARKKITEAVGGKIVTKYKLRDWVFARQRYWGEPFPIVFDARHISYAVADKDLPVKLPQVESYEPTDTGESPLAAIDDWKNVSGYINNDNEFVSVPSFIVQKVKAGEVLDINDDGGLDAYQPKKEVVERNNIACIIKHPIEDKYLISKWKSVTWNGFITGGIEDGDTEEDTARKEVREETGYKNIRSVEVKDFSSHGLFHHPVKGENRFAHYRLVVVKLGDLTQEAIRDEEKAICDLVWVDQKDVESTLTRHDMKSLWQYYREGKVTSFPKRVVQTFTRETNTMPQWAGSSWYYLRYIDPHNDTLFADAAKEKKWSPVDFYVGGAEHATRHLIYARFWHKFLFDCGLVSYDEPFTKLQTVGLIMAEDGRKMSKRWGNIVNPDDVIAEYGADTLRLYEMFMGPFDQSVAWSTSSMAGVRRFVERLYKLFDNVEDGYVDDEEVIQELHKTIKKITEDILGFKFNTAIAQMMILLNLLEKKEKVSKDSYTTFVKLVGPFAPHLGEELYVLLGNNSSLCDALWPTYDTKKLITATVTVAIQIGGKTRGTVTVERNSSDDELLLAVRSHEQYKKYVGDMVPKKTIIIKNKIVNIVI